jgi:hypothetical protein
VTQTSPASDIHPDVLDLAQAITDEVNTLVAGVESLDANKWLTSADKIDALNSQLQALIIPTPSETTTKSSSKSTKS